jgi:adenosylcobinamide kinase/adenosylcobinamide-phosphate guanylyltransferase
VKTLLLGGMRSGKSRYASELARAQAGPVTLIATGSAQDEEMAERIARHKKNRPPEWRVIEEPLRLATALETACAARGLVIVDCLTLWLSNLLCSGDEQAVRREQERLLEVLPALPGDQIFVSNEVGLGIIPLTALARRFADEGGILHQRIAATCDCVVFMVAGLPLAVKVVAPRSV